MHHLHAKKTYSISSLDAMYHDDYSDLNAAHCVETLARRKCTMNLLNCIPMTLGFRQV